MADTQNYSPWTGIFNTPADNRETYVGADGRTYRVGTRAHPGSDDVPESGPWQTDPELQRLEANIQRLMAERGYTMRSGGARGSAGAADRELQAANKAYADYIEKNRRALGIPDNYFPDPSTGGQTLYDPNQNAIRNTVIRGGLMAAGGALVGAASGGGAAGGAASAAPASAAGSSGPLAAGPIAGSGGLIGGPASVAAGSQTGAITGLGSTASLGAGGGGMGWLDLVGGWPGLISNGLSVFNSWQQKKAADDARKDQLAYSNRALDLQERMYDTTRGDLEPYRNQGAEATVTLGELLGRERPSFGAPRVAPVQFGASQPQQTMTLNQMRAMGSGQPQSSPQPTMTLDQLRAMGSGQAPAAPNQSGAVAMRTPRGDVRMIPADRVEDARRAGGVPVGGA